MEYLSSEEISMIFERWLRRRIPRITEPTKFVCGLVTEPGFGSYLHVCTDRSLPEKIRTVCRFDAKSYDERPSRIFLKESIEKSWDFLSELKKNDYVQELKEAMENL